MNSIGERVKELRTAKGLNQIQLSERCGISQPALAKIEIGSTKALKGTTLDALARELLTTTTFLLNGPILSDVPSAPIKSEPPSIKRSGLAERLKASRKALHMSQAELAARAGLSQSAIGNMEAGLRQGSSVNIIDIASALGVTTSYLLHGIERQKCNDALTSVQKLSTAQALELAALFDMIPVHDRIGRAEAYNEATTAILRFLKK